MATDPKDLVVDASVVLKWFVPEEDSSKAIRLRDQHVDGGVTLYAPDLLVYEVANALRYRPDITESDAQSDMEALFSLDMTLVAQSSRSTARALSAARRFNITLYDAVYLELAEDIGCQLVTADHDLHGKAERTRLVNLLGNQ